MLTVLNARKYRLALGQDGFARWGSLQVWPDLIESSGRAAVYLDKIFNGTKPTEPADRTVDKVRVGREPADRERARPGNPASILSLADEVIK